VAGWGFGRASEVVGFAKTGGLRTLRAISRPHSPRGNLARS